MVAMVTVIAQYWQIFEVFGYESCRVHS